MVISRRELEEIDKKLGYVTLERYYADEYLYLLCSVADSIDDFNQKAQFILENIDIYDLKNMSYTDIQWHHKTILEYFFNETEFDYQRSTGKIRMIDCYKDVNNVINNEETDIYLYNKSQSRYFKLNIYYFAQAIKNGLVIHNCSVPGLNKVLKKIK